MRYTPRYDPTKKMKVTKKQLNLLPFALETLDLPFYCLFPNTPRTAFTIPSKPSSSPGSNAKLISSSVGCVTNRLSLIKPRLFNLIA